MCLNSGKSITLEKRHCSFYGFKKYLHLTPVGIQFLLRFNMIYVIYFLDVDFIGNFLLVRMLQYSVTAP